MKKKIVAFLALAAMVVSSLALAACADPNASNSLAGTYSVSLSSGEYYSVKAVQDYFPAHGPSNSQAPQTSAIFQWLNPGIAEDGEFLTEGGVEDYYKVTIVLKEDNTYTLTKEIAADEESAMLTTLGFADGEVPEMKLVFEGSYEAKEGSVTLKKPTHLSGKFVIAPAGANFLHFGGDYAALDVDAADADNLMYPNRFFYYFNTLYFVESSDFTDMSVTVDTTAKTFTIA